MKTPYNYLMFKSWLWKPVLMTVLSLVLGFQYVSAQTVTTAAGDVTWTFNGTSSISEVTLNRGGTTHGDGYDGAVNHTVSVVSGSISNSATFHYSSTYGMGFKKIVIVNTGSTAGTYNLNISGNLGSDGSTRWHYVDANGPTYYSVSSDNTSPTTNGSDPIISFLYGNEELHQLGTSRSLPFTNNSDNQQFNVNGVTIPANSTQIFLVLAGVGDIDDNTFNRPDQAYAALQLLMNEDNWPADFTSFLSPSEKGKVINWNLLSGDFTELVSNNCPEDSMAVLSVQVSGGDAPYTFEWSTGETTTSGFAISGLSLLGHIDEHSYYRSTTPFVSFDAASSFAAANFGYLTSINNATENAWLVSHGALNGDMLGATDRDVEGTFIWDSGEPFIYTNWNSGEPNNGGAGNQDYMQFYSTGFWDDINYNTSAGQLIELPGKSTISGLSAGTYDVTITDANGSIAVATYVVGPQPIDIPTSVTNSICNGSNTGSISTAVTGGTGAYAYAWSNGDTLANLLNAPAGVYSLTVTDANGCVNSASDSVSEPTTIVASSMLDTDVLCFGGANGGATAMAAGGTPTYTYSWSNGATTASITGVTAGTYSVTISDNNGCTDSASVIISEPTALSASGSMANSVSCNGASDGSASSTVMGGTAPYNYVWNTGAITSSITGLSAGTYSVTVTDANGCTSSPEMSVTQPAILNASISAQTNVACNGGNTGSITATSVGGTMPYAYTWSNAATGATATGLSAGTYTVTATDANGCTSTASATITQPTALVSSAALIANVLCNGGSSGEISASATGGAGSYLYSWNNGNTTYSVEGASAGTYSVTVTDANGCTDSSSVVIAQPLGASTTITAQTNVACNGESTGAATASTTGGTAPYNYVWSNGGNTATITGLAAGNYSVTATDANGCTSTSSATITQPSAIVIPSLTRVSVSCNGLANGTLTAVPSGGVSPYAYAWSNANTSASAIGLAVGTYTVTITDANGCTQTSSKAMTQPAAVSASISSQVNVSCNGGANGAATAASTGGTGTKTYIWSNSATGATATGLAAGTYTVTATDANGCISTATSTITEPTALSASIASQLNVTCNGGANGSATVSTTGGTGTSTYLWSNATTGATATGLVAGIYTVTATDANNCTSSVSVTITQPVTASTAITSQTNVACNGASTGAATASTTGGTAPYNYVWSNGGNTATITGLAAGNYTVTATDANGCTSTSSATITEPTPLVASGSMTNSVSCNGGSDGSASTTVSGGTAPYDYVWNTGATTSSVSGLTAGSYTVTVTDANGCTSAPEMSVTQPAILNASISAQTNVACNSGSSGSITAVATGGTMPYTYLWSNATTGATATGLAAGIYTITATDANGCTSTASATITEPSLVIASISAQTNVACNGGSTGSITATTTGGIAPYTYLWSNAATGETASGLAAGTYAVTATDANGCTSTADATITQSTLVVATISTQTNVSCNAGSNGSVVATTSGGVAPYTYLWSNAATGDSASALAAGAYTVTATDANGCVSTANATVTQPTVLTSAVAIDSNVLCNGGSTGGASASAMGGTSPYSYDWNIGETTASITGITAGAFTVTITDNNGCTTTSMNTVTEPTVLASSIAIDSNVSCNAEANGGATASAAGGSAPYAYTWSNAAATASITGLLAGTYTVTITDMNGCTTSSSSTVMEPAAIMLTSIVDSNVTCSGLSNGGATTTVTGGTAPYAYAWSNVTAATASITGLSAGSYFVTVTDANGCTNADSVNITEPMNLMANISSTVNVSCNGGSNGSAMATATDGTLPYTYAWISSTGSVLATTDAITGLTAETYTVIVNDNNGCSSSAVVTISEPNVLTSSAIVDNNVSCNGGTNGGATASAAGGTMPYSFAWSSGATSASVVNFGAGTYTVTTTDANGCTSAASASVSEPTLLVSSVVTDSNVTCNGGMNGGASATASGGTAPYDYAWSSSTGSFSATTASITGLSVGTYTVIVTDANGCTSTANNLVSEPMALMALINADSNVSCYAGANAGLTVVASGGTAPYNYTWNNASTTASITGLSAGVYTVMVIDANNCMVSVSDTTTEPSALTISMTMDAAVACFGESTGSASAMVSGGVSPYAYNWSSGDTAAMASSLSAMTHMVMATDANGCMIMDSILVDGPQMALSASLNRISEIVCNGDSTGALEATANGGWGVYSFEWNTSETTSAISDLVEGSYSVNVTDSLGCMESASESIVHLFELPVVNLGADTTICNNASIELNAGNDGAMYMWSNMDSVQAIQVSDSGAFSVIVTDSNGCMSSDTIMISLDDCVGIAESAASLQLKVYPNPSRGEFQIESNGFNLNESTVTIIDLRGNVVSTIRPQGAVRETITLNQSSGVYFLSIEFDGNVAQQRIIIQ